MAGSVKLFTGKESFDYILGICHEREDVICYSVCLANAVKYKCKDMEIELIMCLHDYLYGDFVVPLINLSLVKVPSGIIKVGLCRQYNPNVIDILYGKTYEEYHKDPIWKGFIGSIFVQSAHIQSICIVMIDEILKDERYKTDSVKSRCRLLRMRLNEIANREANGKVIPIENLETCDMMAYNFKNEMSDLTNDLMNVYFEAYKTEGHPDPFVASICSIAQILSPFYKKILEDTNRTFIYKYARDFSAYLNEFDDMQDSALQLFKACNHVLGYNKYKHNEIAAPPGLKQILLNIQKRLLDKEIWIKICQDT